MLKLYKNDLNYLNGETLGHYIFMCFLIHFHLGTGLFSGDRVINCHYSVNQSFLITWVVRGMMDVLYVYCLKSVGSFKHKLSRIESLVILYWGINCTVSKPSKILFKHSNPP